MSLYYEASEVLTANPGQGGSLKSRIFNKKDLKSTPSQIYALVVETSKWSSVLKDVIEQCGILKLEHKLTPVLSLLLVHDLLLAKKGIALPATHGLRASVERHKARLQAELTKARVRRKMGSMPALKEYVESGVDNQHSSTSTTPSAPAPHPRWVRINTVKTTLEDQISTTFTGLSQVSTVDGVRKRGVKAIYIDEHIPNLVAIPASLDLTKHDAYAHGEIIFQDKASCFPAYLLDPRGEDRDIMDTCAAPGNKTTHLAAVLLSNSSSTTTSHRGSQKIHAFEKDKTRAEVLKQMVEIAGSYQQTQIHAGQDFLRADPNSSAFANVGGLLLDPSCSGSGIVGRDDMPILHIPSILPGKSNNINHNSVNSTARIRAKPKPKPKGTTEPPPTKRIRKDVAASETIETIIDDSGDASYITSESELQTRLAALSAFQLKILLHAMAFPAAKKITYSTCSLYIEENEAVVVNALKSTVAGQRGWRILRRDEQIEGLKKWRVRGVKSMPDRGGDETDNDNVSDDFVIEDEVREACIRANKGDEFGTMGFFLAGFVRDESIADAGYVDTTPAKVVKEVPEMEVSKKRKSHHDEEIDEWGGFGDEENIEEIATVTSKAPPQVATKGVKQTPKSAGGKVSRAGHEGRRSLLNGNASKKRKRK